MPKDQTSKYSTSNRPPSLPVCLSHRRTRIHWQDASMHITREFIKRLCNRSIWSMRPMKRTPSTLLYFIIMKIINCKSGFAVARSDAAQYAVLRFNSFICEFLKCARRRDSRPAFIQVIKMHSIYLIVLIEMPRKHSQLFNGRSFVALFSHSTSIYIPNT